MIGSTILVTLVLSLAFASQENNAEAKTQTKRGETLYAEHCSVCHGKSARGLSEARLAFPEDHRRCESCHRPSNPPQMDLLAMHSRNAFSIGEAPALVGKDALAHFPNEEVLRSYISATMPRPFPGSLSEQDYRDLSAFLLELNAPADKVNED